MDLDRSRDALKPIGTQPPLNIILNTHQNHREPPIKQQQLQPLGRADPQIPLLNQHQQPNQFDATIPIINHHGDLNILINNLIKPQLNNINPTQQKHTTNHATNILILIPHQTNQRDLPHILNKKPKPTKTNPTAQIHLNPLNLTLTQINTKNQPQHQHQNQHTLPEHPPSHLEHHNVTNIAINSSAAPKQLNHLTTMPKHIKNIPNQQIQPNNPNNPLIPNRKRDLTNKIIHLVVDAPKTKNPHNNLQKKHLTKLYLQPHSPNPYTNRVQITLDNLKPKTSNNPTKKQHIEHHQHHLNHLINPHPTNIHLTKQLNIEQTRQPQINMHTPKHPNLNHLHPLTRLGKQTFLNHQNTVQTKHTLHIKKNIKNQSTNTIKLLNHHHHKRVINKHINIPNQRDSDQPTALHLQPNLLNLAQNLQKHNLNITNLIHLTPIKTFVEININPQHVHSAQQRTTFINNKLTNIPPSSITKTTTTTNTSTH